METDGATNLTFCRKCGALRVRDVKDQLKRLFNAPSIKPNACGICKKALKFQSKATDNSSKQGRRTDGTSDHNGNDGNVLNVKCESSFVDISLTGSKPTMRKCEGTNEKVTQAHAKKIADDFDPDYLGCHSTHKKITRLSTGAIKPAKYLAIQGPADSTSDDDNDDDSDYGIKTENSGHTFDESSLVDISFTAAEPTALKCEGTSEKVTQAHEKKTTADFDFNTHRRCHTLERPFMCQHSGCEKIFNSRNSLNVHHSHSLGHRLVHIVPKHKCSMCELFFMSNSKLRRHEAQVHLGNKPHKCVHCGKAFAQNSKRLRHESTVHLKLRPFVCDVCGHTFAVKKSLIVHKRSHTGEKPYACPHCEYRCVRSDYLKKHLIVHSGESPHQCVQCGVKFAQRTTLVLHQKKCYSEVKIPISSTAVDAVVGTPCPTNPGKCGHCGKDFGTNNQRIRHESTVHLKLRPFVCEVCGHTFPDKKALIVHNRSHTGEKPYACPHCEYRCVRSDYLKKHLMVHSGDSPHQCAQCGVKFAQRSTLVLHERRKCNSEVDIPLTSS